MAGKWGVDLREFTQLQKQLEQMEDTFAYFLRSFVGEMANRIVTKTKLKQSGHYGEEYKAFDTGAMANSWQLGKIERNGKNISVEILNPMEYATEIEYGHRIVRDGIEIGWYNGRFMLTTSIDEIKRQMPLRYAQELKAYCDKLGIK